MRIIIHRAIQKFDFAAELFEFVENDHLLDIVASQAVRSGYYHSIKLSVAGGISPAIKPRPVKSSPATTVVAKDVVIV